MSAMNKNGIIFLILTIILFLQTGLYAFTESIEYLYNNREYLYLIADSCKTVTPAGTLDFTPESHGVLRMYRDSTLKAWRRNEEQGALQNGSLWQSEQLLM